MPDYMKIKDFSKGVKIRLIDMFFSIIIGSVLVIAKPLYLVSNFGPKLASLLLIISIVLGILVSFYSGYFSDIIGRRKMLIRAETLQLSALILIVISNSPLIFSPWLTYLGFVLITISGGLYGPASESMLLDLSTNEDRKYMYTYISAINNVAFGIGAVLAGFLFKNHFFLLSNIMVGASILTLLVLILLIKETHKGRDMSGIETPLDKFKDMSNGYKKVLKNKLFLLYFGGSMIAVSFEAQLFNHISVRLVEVVKSVNLFKTEIEGAKLVSILTVENVLVIILFASFVSFLMKKFKERQLITIGIVLATAGYVVLATSNIAIALIVAMIVSTFGELLYIPIKQSYLGDIAEDDSRSSYIAMDSLSDSLGMMGASFLILVGSYLGQYMFILYLLMGGLLLFTTLKLNKGITNNRK